MNNPKTIIIPLFFILSFAFITLAQTLRVENSNSAGQTPVSNPGQQQNDPNNVQKDTAKVNCSNIDAGSIIVVADTSPSVKNQLAAIKARGKEIISLAPPCVRLGVVSINWEAIKEQFDDKAEAGKFIDSLTVGGKYTDLNRGNDAALSLLPTSGKSVIAFMTDGKATVPSTFKNKESFIEILRREYSDRPNVRVFVLNVKGKPLAQSETLPANVTIIPISDWQAAKLVITETLAPQIKQQFITPKTTDNQSSSEEPKNREEARTNNSLLLISAGLIALAAFVAILIVWRKRRSRYQASQEILLNDQPENVLRDEDLQQPPIQEPTPEPVLMVEAVSKKGGQYAIPPLRSFINVNARLAVGGSRLLAEMYLGELCQSQTIEISFDGKVAGVIRLRPSDGEALDVVLLNEQSAPKSFLLNPSEPNQLLVGTYELKFTFTDESMIKLFDTSHRTNPIMLGINQIATQSEESRLPRRRVRSGF